MIIFNHGTQHYQLFHPFNMFFYNVFSLGTWTQPVRSCSRSSPRLDKTLRWEAQFLGVCQASTRRFFSNISKGIKRYKIQPLKTHFHVFTLLELKCLKETRCMPNVRALSQSKQVLHLPTGRTKGSSEMLHDLRQKPYMKVWACY